MNTALGTPNVKVFQYLMTRSESCPESFKNPSLPPIIEISLPSCIISLSGQK